MTRLASNDFLATCEALYHNGYKPKLVAGMRVARGFADLGFEEFCLLPSNRVVSLFTGEVAVCDPDFEQHFFHIPDCDEVLVELAEREAILENIVYKAQRTWSTSLKLVDVEQPHFIEERSLHELLLAALALCLEKDEPKSKESAVVIEENERK